MITKIISKIKIHIFFYILIFIVIITGHFKDFILFTSIILFHELGHIVAGTYYKWKINKIILLPFGALTIFETKINKPFKEEFIVAIMGFVFQIIFYFILKPFNINNLFLFHYSIILFNILPICPLDGFKIVNCILNLIFSFKLSNKISMIISVCFLIPLFLYRNLMFYFILIFLTIRVIDDIKKSKYLMLKFLLERKEGVFNYKKTKIIRGLNLSKMFKYYKNIFYVDNFYYTERYILKEKV
ncbi:MAG: hypothetical protein NC181_01515 [Clostridium sp.]|nr:hypothetical protein [Clostridium sp.]MCM1444483.1 hypothetical protein [Candidatus Amulumruptor caecigallinarius]